MINARGIWDNEPAAKPQPMQSAAATGRDAGTPPPATQIATNVAQALAYAPPAPPLNKSQIVASTAPTQAPSGARSQSYGIAASAAGNDAADVKPRDTRAPAMLRVAATQTNEIWLRAMIVAPSVTTSLSTGVLGDQDMSVMRTHFVKPQVALAIAFSSDPASVLGTERFTGTSSATFQTMTFGMKTAELR
jgi:hypothetical protein